MGRRDIRYQAAIVRHDRLLLVRWEPFSWPAVWLVPGGGREAESEEECVVREVREETGLEVTVDRFLFEQDARDEQTPYQRLKTYLVDAPHGEPHPGEEPEPGAQGRITAVEWFDLQVAEATSVEVTGTPFTSNSIALIREALGYGGGRGDPTEI